MSELNQQARALISRVGDADGPDPAARERVRRALSAAVVAGAATATHGVALAASGAALPKAGMMAAVASWSAHATLTAKVWVCLGAGAALGVAVAAPVAVYQNTQRESRSLADTVALANAPAHQPEPLAARTTVPITREEPGVPEVLPSAIAQSPRAVAPVTPKAAAEPVNTAKLSHEVQLLQAAQRELASGNAAGALAILDRHAAEFPGGSLREERMAARVFALCRLGQTAAARAAAERFLLLAPSSPLAARVAAECGGNSSD